MCFFVLHTTLPHVDPSSLFPAIFYTVGMSTGTAFFNDAQANYKGNPENILNLSWGYAVQCGYTMVIHV